MGVHLWMTHFHCNLGFCRPSWSLQESDLHISSLEEGASLFMDGPACGDATRPRQSTIRLPLRLDGQGSSLYSVSLALFSSPHDAVELSLHRVNDDADSSHSTVVPTHMKHHPSKRVLHAHRLLPGLYHLVLENAWEGSILSSAERAGVRKEFPSQICPFLGLELTILQVRQLSAVNPDGSWAPTIPSLASLESYVNSLPLWPFFFRTPFPAVSMCCPWSYVFVLFSCHCCLCAATLPCRIPSGPAHNLSLAAVRWQKLCRGPDRTHPFSNSPRY